MTDRERDTALREFYLNRLVPAGQARKSTLAGKNRRNGSYFVKRHAPKMTAGEFELRLVERSRYIELLENTWKDSGLAPLARPMIELSKLCTEDKQSSELSSTVYEMF